MNDYQQKRCGDFTLPQPVYRQALWAVKDIERLKQRKDEVEEDAFFARAINCEKQISVRGGMVICDHTGGYAIEVSFLASRISAIENAFNVLPDEYKAGVYNKLVLNIPYCDSHCQNTWKKWQQILLYNVAINLYLL